MLGNDGRWESASELASFFLARLILGRSAPSWGATTRLGHLERARVHLGRRLTLVAWKGGGVNRGHRGKRTNVCEGGKGVLGNCVCRWSRFGGAGPSTGICQLPGYRAPGTSLQGKYYGVTAIQHRIVPSTLDLTCQNTARYCWKWPLPAADPRPRGKA